MLHDLVINPFGAAAPAMVEVAVAADELGFSGVWVTDHFSGAVVGAPWSRDPLVCLGAFAAATRRVGLGVLVANIVNRHPAQLASAINSLQSLAPGRVRLGVGSGAAPDSRFAVEHEAIGQRLGDPATRRRHLVDYVAALRAIWSSEPDHAAPFAGFSGLRGVTDGRTPPPIIVGASAWPTIEVAAKIADGVNIRRTSELGALLARLAGSAGGPEFEVSVLDDADPGHPLGGEFADLVAAGVHRRIRTVSAPFDLARLERVARHLDLS